MVLTLCYIQQLYLIKIDVWYGRQSIGLRLEMTNNLTAFSFDKEVNMS